MCIRSAQPIFRCWDIFKVTWAQNTEESAGQGNHHFRILRVNVASVWRREYEWLRVSAVIKGQEIQEFLTLDDMADKLSRNVGNELPL